MNMYCIAYSYTVVLLLKYIDVLFTDLREARTNYNITVVLYTTEAPKSRKYLGIGRKKQ